MPQKSIFDRVRSRVDRVAEKFASVFGAAFRKREEEAGPRFRFGDLPAEIKAEVASHLVDNIRETGEFGEIRDFLHFLGAGQQTRQLADNFPEIREMKQELERLGETTLLAEQVHQTATETGWHPKVWPRSARKKLLDGENIIAAAPTFKTLPNNEKSKFHDDIFKRDKKLIRAFGIEEIVSNPDYIDHMSQAEKESALVSIMNVCVYINKKSSSLYGNINNVFTTESLAKSINILSKYCENITSTNEFKELCARPYMKTYLDYSPGPISRARNFSEERAETGSEARTNEQLKQELDELTNNSAPTADDILDRARRIHGIGFDVVKNIDSQRRAIMNTDRPRDRSSGERD